MSNEPSRSIIDGKCFAPKDPRPMVTTYFCVYERGHRGSHSWQDPPDVVRTRLLPKEAQA
jgi:hypothetical protein